MIKHKMTYTEAAERVMQVIEESYDVLYDDIESAIDYELEVLAQKFVFRRKLARDYLLDKANV